MGASPGVRPARHRPGANGHRGDPSAARIDGFRAECPRAGSVSPDRELPRSALQRCSVSEASEGSVPESGLSSSEEGSVSPAYSRRCPSAFRRTPPCRSRRSSRGWLSSSPHSVGGAWRRSSPCSLDPASWGRTDSWSRNREAIGPPPDAVDRERGSADLVEPGHRPGDGARMDIGASGRASRHPPWRGPTWRRSFPERWFLTAVERAGINPRQLRGPVARTAACVRPGGFCPGSGSSRRSVVPTISGKERICQRERRRRR